MKYVIVITSATALAYLTNKIVQQSTEMTSMLAVLLANAAVQTPFVDVPSMITAYHQAKYATLITSATALA